MRSLTRKTLYVFWQHAARYPWQVAVLLAGVMTLTAFQTYIPLVYRDLLNLLASGSPAEVFKPAVGLVVFILILNFVKVTSWRGVNFVNNHFQPKVMSDLLNTCYEYLQKHSASFFNSTFVGSLVTKVRRYERAFEQIADQILFELGRSLLDVGMILVVLLWQYTEIGLIVLAWSAVFIAFAYIFARFKLPYDLRRAAADTRTTAQLADSVTNNVNVKLFSNYKLENKRFQATTFDQFVLRRRSWNLQTVGDVLQGFAMITLEFYVIYVALVMWRDGTLNIGDVALLQAYILRIYDKLWGTGRNIKNIYEALADGNEMTEMLYAPHEVQDATAAKALKTKAGQIEFRGVDFGYHAEAPVLRNFNLTIRPGERVAFIGPSGGGKSTITKLLLRFYDLAGGEIAIDGQNIAAVTQDSLRAAIAFVPQEPILFHRSLYENIRYARPNSSRDEVVRAAKLAHAHEFIAGFTQGYDTLVGERGVKLSGGERQRVAIARAILKNAPLLVLDEATSSLDSESEMFIRDALQKLMRGRTTVVIAHRLSTIMQMDRIVVIQNGKIIEEGKHAELLKVRQGIYQKLWGIQAGGFAAASSN